MRILCSLFCQCPFSILSFKQLEYPWAKVLGESPRLLFRCNSPLHVEFISQATLLFSFTWKNMEAILKIWTSRKTEARSLENEQGGLASLQYLSTSHDILRTTFNILPCKIEMSVSVWCKYWYNAGKCYTGNYRKTSGTYSMHRRDWREQGIGMVPSAQPNTHAETGTAEICSGLNGRLDKRQKQIRLVFCMILWNYWIFFGWKDNKLSLKIWFFNPKSRRAENFYHRPIIDIRG